MSKLGEFCSVLITSHLARCVRTFGPNAAGCGLLGIVIHFGIKSGNQQVVTYNLCVTLRQYFSDSVCDRECINEEMAWTELYISFLMR